MADYGFDNAHYEPGDDDLGCRCGCAFVFVFAVVLPALSGIYYCFISRPLKSALVALVCIAWAAVFLLTRKSANAARIRVTAAAVGAVGVLCIIFLLK